MDFFSQIKHSHKIRVGGVLKQMLALWTCEEVFNGCITLFYWMAGFFKLKESKNKKKWEFQCSTVLGDLEFEDEHEFLKAWQEVSGGSVISEELTRSIAKMILRWLRKMKTLESRLKDPQVFKLDKNKIKADGVADLLKLNLSQRLQFDRLGGLPLFNDVLETTEKDSGLICKLSKEDMVSIVDAENLFFFDNIRYRKGQYYSGKEEYLPFSVEDDISHQDIEYWMITNLLSSEYIPLVSICNHFSNSIVDFTADSVMRSTDMSLPVQIFKRSMKKAQLDEIELEVSTFLGLVKLQNPPEYEKLVTYLKTGEYIFFEDLALEVAFTMWETLRKEGDIKSIDPIPCNTMEKELVVAFVEYIDKFLENKLDMSETTSMANFLLNECWLRMVQRIDSSLLVDQSIRPLMESTMKELDILMEKECQQGLIKKRKVFEQNSESGYRLLTLKKAAYCSRVLKSKDIALFYKSLCKNIVELHPSVIVKTNATKSADQLYQKILAEWKKLEANKMNEEPPAEFRYSKHPKKGHYELHEFTRKAMKKVRRLVPEFRVGSSDTIVPKRIWDKMSEFTVRCHWKAHQGLVTWWALLVDGSTYEEAVLTVLRRANFGNVRSRDAAIKIMGLIADHFKIHTDADYKTINPELLKIPYWVFSGADTIFGFTAENSLECKTWKEDLLTNIIDWVGYFPPENFGGLNLNYDFEMAMEHFLRDFKPTYSPYNLEFTDISEKILQRPSSIKGRLHGLRQGTRIQRESGYYCPKDDEGIVVYNDFFSWCKSFLKFSVDGSAQGLKIDVDKLYLAEDEKDEESTVNEDRVKDLMEAQTDSTFGRKVIKNEEVDVPSLESSDLSPEKKREKAMEKAIKEKEKEANYMTEKNAKTKSLTKTLAFALGGKNLARMLFWTGGDNYVPELTIHLKIEKKKIRLVANSDIVSFNKQNYVYDWIHKAFADTSRELVYTFIHPRDKVKRVERFSECFRGEKWQCPMDLKDFQIQFGPVHHKTFMRCLWRRVNSVTYEPIKRELNYLVSSLHDELCKGLIFLRKKTPEDFTDARNKLPPEKQKYIRKFQSELPKEKDPDPDDIENDLIYNEGRFDLDPDLEQEILDDILYNPDNMGDCDDEEDSIRLDKPKSGKNKKVFSKPKTFKADPSDMDQDKEKKDPQYNVFIAFEIMNGLLSGWKMTSMMGSIYNYSTNNMINFWSLLLFGLVPTDYATQGDDTHFKTRFLMSSLFHTAFVNTIGKVAHPQKQFFSTRYTEFLKKTYDMWTKEIRYQPCRIVSSLLFDNEEKENKANNKNSLKDFIDMWNMFLVRIPGQLRTNHIANVLQLPSKSIRMKYNWHSEKGPGGFYELEMIEKLFSSPEIVASFLSGPLTNPNLLCKFDPITKDFTPFSEYTMAKMSEYFLEFKHGLNINKWSGIKSHSNNIIRKLGSSKKGAIAADLGPSFRDSEQNLRSYR
jgi:hypothetical protein